MNIKKNIFGNFEIFSFKGGVGENAEFRKIWIFKHISALNYSVVKKFHIRRLDLDTKKAFLDIFDVLILREKNR